MVWTSYTEIERFGGAVKNSKSLNEVLKVMIKQVLMWEVLQIWRLYWNLQSDDILKFHCSFLSVLSTPFSITSNMRVLNFGSNPSVFNQFRKNSLSAEKLWSGIWVLLSAAGRIPAGRIPHNISSCLEKMSFCSGGKTVLSSLHLHSKFILTQNCLRWCSVLGVSNGRKSCSTCYPNYHMQSSRRTQTFLNFYIKRIYNMNRHRH